MSSRRVLASVILLGIGASSLAPRVARGEGDIVIETPGERPLENKLLVGGLAGAGVLASALGLYFHLDSRSASSDVSASKFTGHAWTADDQALVDRADRSRGRAIIGYSVGGALLIVAAITLIVTEPRSETTVIHPHRARSIPVVAPTEGGALFGGMWSF